MSIEHPNQVLARRISHVSLRVRDLDESAEFYCDVFGLEREDVPLATARRCRCRAIDPGAFAVEMTEAGAALSAAGMEHFTVEVASVSNVDVVCRRARAAGARTKGPRPYGPTCEAHVFDPDGHKIRVVSPRPDAPQAVAVAMAAV